MRGLLSEFIANYLKEKHIDAFVQQIDETHANIIAKLEGKSSETVVWNGHLDTVPYGNTEEWNTDPSIPVERNGRIYARGASDMKSGLAGNGVPSWGNWRIWRETRADNFVFGNLR